MKVKDKEYTLWNKAVNLFYPERCPYCNKVISLGALCCEECEKELTDIEYHTYARGGYLTISTFPYTGIFADAIKRFKFQNGRQFSYQLARMMADTIVREYGDREFDMITFVPLHPKNQKQRGYNQSELLAKELSQILSIPLVSALRKTRYNKPQHSLKRVSEREKNVKGVYRLTEKNIAKDKRILIIDDIITTGNTLGECARTLTLGEAQDVVCATFAIAVTKTT